MLMWSEAGILNRVSWEVQSVHSTSYKGGDGKKGMDAGTQRQESWSKEFDTTFDKGFVCDRSGRTAVVRFEDGLYELGHGKLHSFSASSFASSDSSDPLISPGLGSLPRNSALFAQFVTVPMDFWPPTMMVFTTTFIPESRPTNS